MENVQISAHSELEARLKVKAKKTRLVLGIVTAVFFVAFIVFMILRESTGIRTEIFPGYTEVRYKSAYNVLSGVAFIVFAISAVYFVASFILNKIDTVEVDGNMITLYRGWGVALYINGRKAENSGYYLTGKLRDGSTVTVSLSRNRIFAHMTFSNGHKDIEL